MQATLDPGSLGFGSAPWRRSLFSPSISSLPAQPPLPQQQPRDQRQLVGNESRVDAPQVTQESPSGFLSCFLPGTF